jgi:hypothetical protein
MSGHPSPSPPRREVRETIQELRRHLGLFSFGNDVPGDELVSPSSGSPELGVRAGGIIECLVARHGGGGLTAAMKIMAQSFAGGGFWAVVDPDRQFYAPALSGWGIDPCKVILLRPSTREETWWAIEECLRSTGIGATWAWVDERIPVRIHRRWLLAAEAGGGVGLFFRPITAIREPVWAEVRLLMSGQAEAEEGSRRLKIEVLYRRGGLGGITRAWEIDHAAGLVRLVPEVANPASMERKARA